MSADSFHHLVENEIREKKRMYHFDDFVNCVENCGVAIQMKPEDFIDYRNEKGSGKDVNCPLLQKISVIQSIEYEESEFLMKKTRKAWQSWREYPGKGAARGITHSKKVQILAKLKKFMLPCHISFWGDLHSSENASDLTINLEHLPKET